MARYDHASIEGKWQKRWEESGAYRVERDEARKKLYLLIEFPYPSGAGLHVGHVRSYTALDAIARKKRAEGFNVLYPIGWDAFGLPTENYAVKTGIHPKQVTKDNTDTFRRQMKSLGFSFDWSREINTTDPSYYKWTQWIFLQLWKSGLAYKAKMPINWCLSCKIGLANEEVVDGRCERCGGETEKRDKEQWMLAITKYADRLHDDLDEVEYWEKIKTQQRNWIGRSEGAEIDFKVKDSDEVITVFTTRADTLFGATYMVLAPEHALVQKLKRKIENVEEVASYIREAGKKSEIERTAEGKEKTGVELKGIRAINPANKEEIPVFISDYVLAQYGTGAIMAVPAHDDRDFAFAKKFGLDLRKVITGGDDSHIYTGDGVLLNSAAFDGLMSSEAREKITKAVGGRARVTYKLRDWIFSRQRYWGEPIPLVHCEKDGWVAVPDAELPVELPDTPNFKPTDSGEAPLAAIEDWVKTTCPSCGGPARRETDTMPNWAGSSWYYLRYTDPDNDEVFASKANLEYFTPVDWYNGGMEHTTLHLLYSRFWHKFLFDTGLVPTKEPYLKRTSHGLILAADGTKMSKSKGNVVNPDEIVSAVGADTLRLYEMFLGPFDQPVAWNPDSVAGVRRFLERVHDLCERVSDESVQEDTETILHQTIEKVSKDIDALRMNTAVSSLMILSNHLAEGESVPRKAYETLLMLLAPFSPHLAHELWEKLGNKEPISRSPWPAFDPEKAQSQRLTIAVQVNGKVRATLDLPKDATEGDVKAAVHAHASVQKWIAGKEVAKEIYITGRIYSLVVK